MRAIKAFLKNESGATAVEYGLLASLIAVAIIIAITALGDKLSALFLGIETKIKVPT